MKVILLQEVKDIGAADTLKDVADGYARNFLFPNKLAIIADKHAMKGLEVRKKARDEQQEKEKASLREIASKLKGLEINIAADAGESGKLFGSVTSQDIASKVYESFGIEVDKKKIVIEEPIKTTGTFDVPVRFAADISVNLKVNVTQSPK